MALAGRPVDKGIDLPPETASSEKPTPPTAIRLELSTEAERYVRRDAPVAMRRMAAGGALPLPPAELVSVLFTLHYDEDREVAERALHSLSQLPERVRDAALQSPLHPAVLALCAELFREVPDALQVIALNPATSDATIAYLAGQPQRTLLEIIAGNQQRLLRCPDIVDALGQNPMTGRAVIDRVLSFLGIERPAQEEFEEADLPPPEPITDAQASAALSALLGDDVSQFDPELIRESDSMAVPTEPSGSLYILLQKMSVVEKIKLARMGNREARWLLARDPNKLVACAAARSPKTSETEVVAWVRARSTNDEVLRVVSRSREWMRHYNVKLALVSNPKTSLPVAMKLLNYIQLRDLKQLAKSRDVSGPVSQQARRLVVKKMH